MATSAAVPKPYSSAPSSAAMMTSRPVLQAAVGAQRHVPAHAVEHEDLLRLGEAQSPTARRRA
jgi:hypothetical protein